MSSVGIDNGQQWLIAIKALESDRAKTQTHLAIMPGKANEEEGEE
jgi:hypothetical protein